MSFNFPKSSLLIGLETSEVSIEPDFVQGVVTYRATVEKERAVLGITPRALSPTATVKVNDLPASSFPALIPLVFGENNVLISVVDDDAESTYNLIVTRSGGLLSGLSINSGNTTIELPQQFEPNVFNYTVTAKNSDTAIRFLPSAVIPGSTITINNIAVVSGQLSEQFELLEGLNEFEIVVNSNGSALTYYISITRPISLLLISALIAYSGRSLSGTVLVPMNSTDLVYDKAIPSASTSVRITPTSASNNVNVTINNIPVVSGGQSGSITLGSGVTPVYISVATLDGQQVRNYTLNISKS